MRAKAQRRTRAAAGLCGVRARPGVGDAPDERTPRVRERRAGELGWGAGTGPREEKKRAGVELLGRGNEERKGEGGMELGLLG